MEEQCRPDSLRSAAEGRPSLVHSCAHLFRRSRLSGTGSHSALVPIGGHRTAHSECLQRRHTQVAYSAVLQAQSFCLRSEITAKEFLAALPARRLTPQKLRCLNDLARGLLMQIPGACKDVRL